MAGVRALPDLVSRIRVDSSGVDAGIMGLVKSFGKADLALAGVAAGIGLLVAGGKSMIDISEKYARAENDLTQAINSRNAAHGKTIPAMDQINKATTSLAKATRQLAEFDAGHSGVIITKTSKLKSLASQTAALESANRRLAEFDVQYSGKKLTQLQAMRRQDLENAIAAAGGRLAGADRGGYVSSSGGLTPVQLMHRADLLKKVAAAHKAVSDAQHGGAKQTMVDGPLMQSQMDEFIKTNRRYISDQSEVVDGYATLTRSGLTQNEVTKDMNRALDIAALKDISLSDAVGLVNNAEHGRLRGLIDLGITTGQYVDSQGNLIKGSKDVGKAMDELDSKTKKGRDTLTEVQQHSNQLSNDWQDLSKKGGPVLQTLLDSVITKVTSIYDWFDKIGKDDALWARISERLVSMGQSIHEHVLGPLGQLWEYANRNVDNNNNGVPDAQETSAWKFLQHQKAGMQPPAGKRFLYNKDGSIGGIQNFYPGVTPGDLYSGRTGRWMGGPVVPGSVYTVGERGPETLHMNADGSGGFVVPDGGAGGGGGGRGGRGGDTYHFHQVMVDPWQVASEISWTKKTQRL